MEPIFWILGGAVIFIVFGYKYMNSYNKKDFHTQDLENKYSTDMNRFSAEKERKASEARTSLLTQVNQEISQVSERDFQVFANKELPDNLQRRKKELESEHRTLLAQHENTRIVLDHANQEGLSPLTYEQIRMLGAAQEFELKKKQLSDWLDVEKKRMLDELEVRKLESENRVHLQLGFEASLADHQKIKTLQEDLHELYKKQDEVLRMNLAENVKTQMLNNIGETILKLEQNYEQRLLQIGSGQVVRGSDKNPQSEGHTGEAVRPASE